METLRRALAEAVDATRAVRHAAAELAGHPDHDIEALTQLARTRDRACLDLGKALSTWLLDGGTLSLDGEPYGPPQDAPADPATSPAPRAVEPPPRVDPAPRSAEPPPRVEPAARVIEPPPAVPTATRAAVVRPPPASYTPEPRPAPPLAAEPEVKPEPPAPRPAARPATADELAALSKHLLEGRIKPAPPPVDERVQERASRFGQPVPLANDEAARNLLDAHLQALSDLDGWLELEKSRQRALLGYAVAQARYAQEVLGGQPALPPRHHAVFGRYTSWSKEHQPGFVHGLMTGHEPRHGTWLDDARTIWTMDLGLGVPRPPVRPPKFSIHDVNVALTDGVPDDVLHQILLDLLDHPEIDQDHLTQVLVDEGERLGHPKLKKLKKRVAKLAKTRAEQEVVREDVETIPTDWPWASLCLGKRAVMLGGDARQNQEQRIHTVFGFESLVWETGWDNRRVESLAERIRSGNVDLLLIIQRFVNHTATNTVVPVCKEFGVPFVFVPGGYGVSQIQHAIETKLPRP